MIRTIRRLGYLIQGHSRYPRYHLGVGGSCHIGFVTPRWFESIDLVRYRTDTGAGKDIKGNRRVGRSVDELEPSRQIQAHQVCLVFTCRPERSGRDETLMSVSSWLHGFMEAVGNGPVRMGGWFLILALGSVGGVLGRGEVVIW